MDSGKDYSLANLDPATGPAILIVDDDDLMRAALEEAFADDYIVHTAASGQEAVNFVANSTSDVACVIMDMRMPGMDGTEAIKRIRAIDPVMGTVVYTGFAGDYSEKEIENEVGAVDYVTKGGDLKLLANTVKIHVEKYLSDVNSHTLADMFRDEFQIIGRSAVMRELYRRVYATSKSSLNAILTGESGVGKELTARAVHHLSGRTGQLIAVNCSERRGEHFEIEIVGVRKGVYSNVYKDVLGVCELAKSGTLFLDEVSTLPYEEQGKLLRIVQDDGEFTPMGGRTVKADLRVICATNERLEAMVEQGLFRSDLYHRLNGCQIEVPPLEKRVEDIPELVEFFAANVAKKREILPVQFDSAALAAFMRGKRNGNVRQLSQDVERVIVESGTNLILEEDVLKHCNHLGNDNADCEKGLTLKERTKNAERNIIIESLMRNKCVSKDAATELKTDPATLSRKMTALGIDLRELQERYGRDRLT